MQRSAKLRHEAPLQVLGASVLLNIAVHHQPYHRLDMSSTAPSAASKEELAVDLVLIFEARNPKLLKAKKSPSAEEVKSTSAEYENLVSNLQHVGLDVTARQARNTPENVLILVRAPNAALVQHGKQESFADYLHGVQSNYEPAGTSSLSRSSSLGSTGIESQAKSFSQAERARYTYELVTRPRPNGADVRVGSKEFPHLKDITPIHDREYNTSWLKRWASIGSMIQISTKEYVQNVVSYTCSQSDPLGSIPSVSNLANILRTTLASSISTFNRSSPLL